MIPNDWNRDAMERLRQAVLHLDMCTSPGCGYVIYDADAYDEHLSNIHPNDEVSP